MSAPPLKGNALACAGKRRHADEFIARAAAANALERQGQELDRLSVYHCPSCRGWHLTSKNYGRASSYNVTPLELVPSRDAQWPDLLFIQRMLVEACDGVRRRTA